MSHFSHLAASTWKINAVVNMVAYSPRPCVLFCSVSLVKHHCRVCVSMRELPHLVHINPKFYSIWGKWKRQSSHIYCLFCFHLPLFSLFKLNIFTEQNNAFLPHLLKLRKMCEYWDRWGCKQSSVNGGSGEETPEQNKSLNASGWWQEDENSSGELAEGFHCQCLTSLLQTLS